MSTSTARNKLFALGAVVLGLGVVTSGCATGAEPAPNELAASMFHPSYEEYAAAATTASTPTTSVVGGDQVALDTTGVGNGVVNVGDSLITAGTTRETAGTGAIGGGPIADSPDGGKTVETVERRGHLGGATLQAAGEAGVDLPPVSRTGK